MIKIQKYHQSITENGNLQLRIVSEYQDDEGKVLDKKYSEPMTPADTKDMTGWDDRSKDIVAAITDEKVIADLQAERLAARAQENGLVMLIDHDRVIEEDGKIAVRRITKIFDEGIEVSKKYHRSWIIPGDDPRGADVISRALAEKIHTSKCVSDYKAKIAELELV